MLPGGGRASARTMSTEPLSSATAGKGTLGVALLPIIWVVLAGAAEGRAPAQQPVPARVQAEAPRTIENDDARLKDALASLRESRTCSTLTQVGTRYFELEVLDVATAYIGDAVKLDAKCAVAHDALAKVWRGQGLHSQALGSAHRAVYFSPTSAAFWNTYGTIMQEVGRMEEAAAAYRRVTELDATAAYAHSNLCYLGMLSGDTDRAASACLAALAIDPNFVPALNNLALLRAASGEAANAFELFASAGGKAAAHYNMGMVRLSQRDFPAALSAFEAAYREDAAFDAAHEKARLVRRILKQRSEKLSADDSGR